MTARPIPLLVAGAACIAFSRILVRLADVTPSTAAFYRCAYAIPPLAAIACWERRRFGWDALADIRLDRRGVSSPPT